MNYKVYFNKNKRRFLVSETNKWHYSRSRSLKKVIKQILTAKQKVKYSWMKSFRIGYKSDKLEYGGSYHKYLQAISSTKYIILYKPKENKKGIRVIYDTRMNFTLSKNYIVCYDLEQIDKAINRYVNLHTLFN